MTCPYHLVVDGNGFSLVVENGGSKRVVMLDNELRFMKELIPESIGLSDPMRIGLDCKRGRLLVANFLGDTVIVFDFMA